MSIELVMPTNHLILYHPLLLLPSISSSVRVFPNKSVLHIRWPIYWRFSFSISSSNEYSGLISLGLPGLSSLQSKEVSRVLFRTTVQKCWFFCSQPSLCSCVWKSLSHIWLFATPWTIPSTEFSRPGVGCFSSLAQQTFPTQESNPGFLHYRWFFTSWTTRETQEYWSG